MRENQQRARVYMLAHRNAMDSNKQDVKTNQAYVLFYRRVEEAEGAKAEGQQRKGVV